MHDHRTNRTIKIVAVHTYDPKQPNAGEVISDRSAKALFEVLQTISECQNVQLLYFVTKVTSEDGTNEMEVNKAYLLSHLAEIKEEYAFLYPVFDHFLTKEIENILQAVITVVDEPDIPRPGNTTEFVTAVAAYFIKHSRNYNAEVVLISSADHVPRVLNEAVKVFRPLRLLPLLCVKPATGNYGPDGDVWVVETPITTLAPPEFLAKIIQIIKSRFLMKEVLNLLKNY